MVKQYQNLWYYRITYRVNSKLTINKYLQKYFRHKHNTTVLNAYYYLTCRILRYCVQQDLTGK